METRHDSVLLTEAIERLAVQEGDTVVDATIGGAGHFVALMKVMGPKGTLVGIDADHDAVERARAAVAERKGEELPRIELVEDNFSNLASILAQTGATSPNRVLFDLGWSSFQLTTGKGFSFRADEPLLMTYGSPETSETTAADLVNHLSETSLADMIFSLGEERFSRGIAKSIVAARTEAPITSTFALVEAIEAGVPAWYRHRKLHPATKTFQALRIAVNNELGALRSGLSTALATLAPEGRIAVITFHSIEDRIVKSMFRDAAYAGQGTLVSKKPIVPSAEELLRNPRARSAKLRVFESVERGDSSFISKSLTSLYA
jgi:16S rRNA (cytosine1402-N4)-methyltransferase|tara:strand:+ start:93337 stop:94293 length:957 start_codon:yes stop_codon:yes gene_type:complete